MTCALCDCTWESSTHLFSQYMLSQAVWRVIFHKLLYIEPCDSPKGMVQSIIKKLDSQNPDLQCL